MSKATALATNQVMNELEIKPLEYKGERCLTLKMVDTIHERPDGTAGRNFRENKEELVINEDYFLVPYEEFKHLQAQLLDSIDEFVSTKFVETNNSFKSASYGARRDQVLITESGYLLLVKSFQDPLAWKVQRHLVNHYFRSKSLQTRDQHLAMAEITKEITRHLDNVSLNLASMSVKHEAIDGKLTKFIDKQEDFNEKILGEVQRIQKRQAPKERTKRILERATAEHSYGKCPACRKTQVLNANGFKNDNAEWDHWYSPSRNQAHEMWLVCKDCNRKFGLSFNSRNQYEYDFMSFQKFMERSRNKGPRQMDLFSTCS